MGNHERQQRLEDFVQVSEARVSNQLSIMGEQTDFIVAKGKYQDSPTCSGYYYLQEDNISQMKRK